MKPRVWFDVLLASLALSTFLGIASGQEVKESAEKKAAFTRVQVFPVDEASQVPSFKTFRDQMIVAVKRREVKFLLGHVDDRINFSFGAGPGKKEFIEKWALDKEPQKSGLWRELDEVLTLGGSFHYNPGDQTTGPVFWSPYTFTNLPKECDAYNVLMIVGKKIKFRAAPSSKAPLLFQLDHDVVNWTQQPAEKKVEEEVGGEKHYWEEVTIFTGAKGYVYGKYARSPIDYRASFVKKNGLWMMVTFIAGD